jgi:hypothetical protein
MIISDPVNICLKLNIMFFTSNGYVTSGDHMYIHVMLFFFVSILFPNIVLLLQVTDIIIRYLLCPVTINMYSNLHPAGLASLHRGGGPSR